MLPLVMSGITLAAVPAVVGLTDIEIGADYLMAGTHRFGRGDVVSVERTAGTLYQGTIQTQIRYDPNLETLRTWAADRNSEISLKAPEMAMEGNDNVAT